jgi:hypothetical protein
MTNSKRTLEFEFERTIPAPPGEVFDGWLDPKIPGNPWNMADKLLLNPKVDGFSIGASRAFPIMGDLPRWSDRVESSTRGCHRTLWEKNRQ